MLINDIENMYGKEKLNRLYDMMLNWDSVTLVECLMELYTKESIKDLMSNFNDEDEEEF